MEACEYGSLPFIMRENDIRTSKISKVKKLNNTFVDGFASITFFFTTSTTLKQKTEGSIFTVEPKVLIHVKEI